MCARHYIHDQYIDVIDIFNNIIDVIDIFNIQFAVIVIGEALAAKNDNQTIQNYTRKIVFNMQKP